MVMAAELSGIGDSDTARLRGLIDAAGLPGKPPSVGGPALRDAMSMDKKVLQKQLRFVLLSELGSAGVTAAYDETRLTQVLEAAD